ncbi:MULTISPECIES: hypothetical protein [Stutzerimonas stutzeri subgroup]|nr:hypothetical protein [Stutzerimonas kunmingensis]
MTQKDVATNEKELQGRLEKGNSKANQNSTPIPCINIRRVS